MCDGRNRRYPCGEDEFRRYAEALAPDQVVYPTPAMAGAPRHGVMVNRPAQQWEIVVVHAGRPQHVAFVFTSCCLAWVLEKAATMSGTHQG